MNSVTPSSYRSFRGLKVHCTCACCKAALSLSAPRHRLITRSASPSAQLCKLAGYLPERRLVTGPRLFKEIRALFELQDDENGQLNLQERQQGNDNKEGHVEVSSAILIDEGVAGDRLTVPEVRDAERKALRNQLRQCTNVEPKDTTCASEEHYGDALAFPWPWSQGTEHREHEEQRCAVHHDVLRQHYLPHAFIDPGTSRT